MAQSTNQKSVIGFQVAGIVELKENIAALVASVKGDETLSSGKKSAITVRAKKMLGLELREAANIIAAGALRNMKAARWPHETFEGVFRYFDPNKPRRSTALAGIAKRTSMVEWYGGKGRGASVFTKSGKTGYSGTISMSLAAMYEYGTSKMRAKPALRPAISGLRSQVLDRIADGYRKVITTFDWSGKA